LPYFLAVFMCWFRMCAMLMKLTAVVHNRRMIGILSVLVHGLLRLWKGAEYCDEHLYVYVYACLSTRVSQNLHEQTSRHFCTRSL